MVEVEILNSFLKLSFEKIFILKYVFSLLLTKYKIERESEGRVVFC